MIAESRSTGFERALFATLFAMAVFGFPALSTLPVFLGVESRPVSVAYRVLVLTASLVFLALAIERRRAFVERGSAMLVLGLMGLMSARMVWDSAASSLPLDLNWAEFASISLGVTFLPALAFLVRVDQVALDLAYRFMVRLGTTTIVLILGASVVALSDLSALRRLTTGVLNSITIGHVGVSLFILLAFSPSNLAAAQQFAGGRAWLRYLGLFSSAVLVLASGSKGPLLVWVLVVAGWVSAALSGAKNGRKRWRAVTPALTFVVALSVAVFLVNSVLPLGIVDRVVAFATDPSTSDRVRILGEALLQFEESPLLGSATVELSSRFYPHNVVVESLMAGGVVAFGLLATLLVRSSATVASVGFLAAPNCWISWLFLQFGVDAMVSGSLYFSPQFWVLVLVVLGLERPKGHLDARPSLAEVHR